MANQRDLLIIDIENMITEQIKEAEKLAARREKILTEIKELTKLLSVLEMFKILEEVQTNV